ncbi:MAG: DUF262 domain-containing protein [Tissierellia bacterium]|nr:DUF262 domain-containing protein [Tissierellia bacterium]
MKYKDISQFTAVGSYEINMPLRYLKAKIDEWVNDTVFTPLQLNPDFQRGHVWTEEQQIKYLEYLLKGGKSARVIYFNHPNWQGSYIGEFVCVDGLQRLTACIRFLDNEIPAFGTYYNDFEDKIPFDINLLFNVNNLKTRKEVLQWYIEFNTGGTVHTEEEIERVKRLLKKEMGE